MSILSNLRAVQSGSHSAKKIYQMFKKWMERARGVSVNRILITSDYCLGGVVKMLCKCVELIVRVC